MMVSDDNCFLKNPMAPLIDPCDWPCEWARQAGRCGSGRCRLLGWLAWQGRLGGQQDGAMQEGRVLSCMVPLHSCMLVLHLGVAIDELLHLCLGWHLRLPCVCPPSNEMRCLSPMLPARRLPPAVLYVHPACSTFAQKQTIFKAQGLWFMDDEGEPQRLPRWRHVTALPCHPRRCICRSGPSGLSTALNWPCQPPCLLLPQAARPAPSARFPPASRCAGGHPPRKRSCIAATHTA